MTADNLPEQTQDKPLYLGHRARLRERFLKDNGASMADYELLELLLTMALPRRDVKPLAKQLLMKFGDLAGVINAPAKDLISENGISENTLAMLKVVAACGLRSASEKLYSRKENVFNIWSEFTEYCRQKMAYDEVERSRAFYFDSQMKLLGEEELGVGTLNKVNVDLRKMSLSILTLKATGVIMAHNHPSGGYNPSDEDIIFTNDAVDALLPFDANLIDHLIITRGQIYSFKNAGLLPSAQIKKFNRLNKTKKLK